MGGGDGRSVIVTGAASGIGRATALRFAQSGARLLLDDLAEEGLEATAAAARAAGAAEALTHVADVAVREQVEALVARAVQRFGGLDVMVANAGVSLDAPFLELSEEQLERTLAVNVKGVFWCGQAAARAMLAGEPLRGGHIVNIASTYGEVTAPECAAYSASKGAVRMLTKAMAVELGPLGLRVNAVAPGWIRTAMSPFLGDAALEEEIRRSIPVGRIGSPEEVASVIHFLTGGEARYINGETIFVDGGWIVQ
jgi:glucose 1-dehydrogenase